MYVKLCITIIFHQVNFSFLFYFLHYSVLLVYKVLIIVFMFVLQMNLMTACLKDEIYLSKIKFKNVNK